MAPTSRDSYINEYYQIRADLKGISPKLELYKVLHKRMQELAEIIGEEK
jgi:hypothetical protein